MIHGLPSRLSMVFSNSAPTMAAGIDDSTSSQASRPSGLAGWSRCITTLIPSRMYTTRSRRK